MASRFLSPVAMVLEKGMTLSGLPCPALCGHQVRKSGIIWRFTSCTPALNVAILLLMPSTSPV